MSYDWQRIGEGSTVRILPQHGHAMIRAPRHDYVNGKRVSLEPELEYNATPKQKPACILCGIQGGSKHTVFGTTVYAHEGCIAALERTLQQPEKPARKAPTTITNNRAGRGGDDRQARQVVLSALNDTTIREVWNARLKEKLMIDKHL